MVFSASSTTSLLGESGDGAYYLKRTLLFGAVGLLVMRLLSVRGVQARATADAAVLGGRVRPLRRRAAARDRGRGQRRARAGSAPGCFQIQPSELMKVALILYGAHLLATRPKMIAAAIGTMVPVPRRRRRSACLLVVGVEPDLGTALVACFAIAALLIAAGRAAARPRPARRARSAASSCSRS